MSNSTEGRRQPRPACGEARPPWRLPNFRVIIQKYDRAWACPARVAGDQYEDPGHVLRVERLQEAHDWYPPRCWALRDVDRYPKPWFLPGWWATRRAADDEARRVLASRTATDDSQDVKRCRQKEGGT